MTGRALGSCGLAASTVGLGAGRLGGDDLLEAAVEHLLLGAVDRGVTLIDTAPGYGRSEERIGRHLGPRRRDVTLATKLGYGVPGVADWTGECISRGVEQALRVLRTDVIDLAQLHSCPRDVLARGEVVEALRRAVDAGKVRAAGYSGEGEALAWAVDSGAFEVVQASVNVCDQASARGVLHRARERGLGVLAKRPLANAPWRPGLAPAADDEAARAYAHRWRALGLRLGGDEVATALRFTLFHTPAHAALVGTRRLSALDEALAAADRGPLDDEVASLIAASFTARGADWRGMV